MSASLLFLPDISGFTEFVQTTEVSHSQHVIAELLEVLVEANTQELQLAEVEGDALFFYKTEIPSQEKLLAQVETMFTAFYSHLKLLEKNRICPCNACSSAPKLQLKIVAHCGDIEFITVQEKHKPFGTPVIEAHRLLKNSVNSDNYVLFSEQLTEQIKLPTNYHSKLFQFHQGNNSYDGKELGYYYAIIDKEALKLKPFAQAQKVVMPETPTVVLKREFPIAAKELLEQITNYAYRHYWAEGVEKIEFNENEVTRVGSPHVCIINGKQLNFTTVVKDGKPNQLVYGEHTTNAPPIDNLYQFFIITPLTSNSCILEMEIYLMVKSPLKKLMIALFIKKAFRKNISNAIDQLFKFVTSKS